MQTAAPSLPIPKRSRRRWYVVGGFALFLIGTPFVYLLVIGHWREHELEQIYREMDAEDPNWRWADLVKQLPPAPPDERNAMVQLQKVIAIMKPTPFGNGPFGGTLPKPVNARLNDADVLRLREALAALAPTVLDEARKLKDMPEGCVVIDPAARSMDVNFNAMKLLNVTRVLEHDALLHAQDGKMEEAVEACLAIAHSAHAVGDFPQLLAQLVRTANQVRAVGAIERTLGQGFVDEERLESLQTALAIEAKQNGICNALWGERAGMDDYYQALRDGKIPAEKFINEMGIGRSKGKLYLLFPNMLLRGYPESLRLKNEMMRACKLKDEAQIDALRKIEPTSQSLASPWDHSLFLFGQIKELRSDHTRVRFAVAAIAAERYRIKYDQWPKGIAELMKEGLLKEPLTDPYDGQPLRFVGTDTGLIVYSVGADKIDNQGKKDDIAFDLWLPNFRATAPAAELEAPKVKR